MLVLEPITDHLTHMISTPIRSHTHTTEDQMMTWSRETADKTDIRII